MRPLRKYAGGFSLTEMLIATGIMAIGLVLIATIFPVGVKLTGLSAERSIAAVAADEAFAKIQLHGLRNPADWPAAQIAQQTNDPQYAPNWADATYDFCDDYLFTADVIVDPGTDGAWGTADDIYNYDFDSDGNYGATDDEISDLGDDGIGHTADDFFNNPGVDGTWGNTDDVVSGLGNIFLYPTEPLSEGTKYHWSALCRRVGNKDVQVTVFVNRKTFAGMKFYGFYHDRTAAPYNNPSQVPVVTSIWPRPVPVNVIPLSSTRVLSIGAGPGFIQTTNRTFFDEGYTIVDDYTGNIYRILEMKDENGDGFLDIVLMDDWQIPAGKPATITDIVWVVPPGVGSSRYPCVGVFQKVIRFDEIE